MTQRSLLDDVFHKPEQEVKAFADVMSTPLADEAMPGLGHGDVARIQSGTPDRVKTPVLVSQTNGRIQLQHGWDDTDYVWHIEPHKSRRGWQASLNRVIYAAARTMNEVIPSTTQVKIFKPYMEWEIKVVTFKALDLRSVWNVTAGDIEKMNLKLFEVLSTLV